MTGGAIPGPKLDTTNYNSVLKTTKKGHITEDNIGEIMLTQIPNVSVNVAHLIMAEHKTIRGLIKELSASPNCLDNMKMTNNGKERKISKTSIANIKKYLFQE